jgi:hypothetical protein
LFDSFCVAGEKNEDLVMPFNGNCWVANYHRVMRLCTNKFQWDAEEKKTDCSSEGVTLDEYLFEINSLVS